MHKLLVIQDNTLKSMAAQKRFLTGFPFLASLNKINEGRRRSSCCRSSNNRTAETYAAAKRTIAALPPAKKNELKKLLNARQLRIIYRQPGGKMIQLTF